MTFLSYFLFWFYFALVVCGVALSCVSAIFGGLIAYENRELKKVECDGILLCLGVASCLTGIGGVIGCMFLSKFVLNPLFKTLPDLF